MKKIIVAVLILFISLILTGCNATTKEENKTVTNQYEYLIKPVEYPVQDLIPLRENYQSYVEFDKDFQEYERNKNLRLKYENMDSFNSFYRKTINEFLSLKNKENIVYSPLSVYFALSMLAEVTANNTQNEILDFLGYDSIQMLREDASSIWNSNYNNDGSSYESNLANSIWLNSSLDYKEDAINNLKDYHHAYSFIGDMGSKDFDEVLHKWINDRTGNLLENEASELDFDYLTLLALVSTLYFKDSWEEKFSESFNTMEPFFSEKEEIVEYLNTTKNGSIYNLEKFSSISLNLESNGKVSFILPNENETIESILNDNEIVDFIVSKGNSFKSNFGEISIKIPKFDVKSSLDLIDSLKKLGISECFDSNKADFSNITSIKDTYVSEIKHSSRVLLDEDGVTGASFTYIEAKCTSAFTENKYDFICNRPFIFVIYSPSGIPVFIGSVYNII